MRTIRRLPDPEAVSRAAAQDLVELARAAIADRGRFCVALSGGNPGGAANARAMAATRFAAAAGSGA